MEHKNPINREFGYWHPETNVFKGGWFFRAFDLVQFIKKLEADPRGGKVVGLRFDGNNVELFTELDIENLPKKQVK